MKKLMLLALLALLPDWGGAADKIADFGFPNTLQAAMPDRTGNVRMIPGPAVKTAFAPGGIPALEFNGTEESVSKLDVNAVRERLDGVECSFSFMIRIDEPQKGLKTGLGAELLDDGEIQFAFPWVGPGDAVVFRCPARVEKGKWHHVALTFSALRKTLRIFFDGKLVREVSDGDYFPLILNFDRIGTFKGAMASWRIWDGIAKEEDLTEIQPGAEIFDDLLAQLEKKTSPLPRLEAMRQKTVKTIQNIKARKKMPLSDFVSATGAAGITLELLRHAEVFRKTEMENAPAALVEVPLCSPVIRTPDRFPTDGTFTAELKTAAAKGQREAFSFILLPYETVEKFEFECGQFVSDSGAALPASILDRKVVKCWYQPGWNNRLNTEEYVLLPDLLLNDETLVKVDEIHGRNYIRINYPSGAKYCDLNDSGTKEDGTAKPFNFCTEPVRDAATLQSVRLEPGRAKQFVFTVRVPRDAKDGLYHASVRLKADGRDAGAFRIALRVYPFELPPARTHYDLNEPFLTFIVGNTNLNDYFRMTGDKQAAERILRDNLRNFKDHQILYPEPCMDTADPDLFRRDLALRKEEGFPLKPVLCAGIGFDDTPLRKRTGQGKTLDEATSPETMKNILDAFEKKILGTLETLERELGHRDVYFYGIDEATDADTLAYQAPFRTVIFKHGGKIFTTGANNNLNLFPSYENLHAIAGANSISRELAARWHESKCKLISYATPFAGPENPDLMRRSHGLRMYLADFDGWYMLSYCSGVHIWNDHLNGHYRNFLLAYITPDGPVNTLAVTGLGAGIDDVRYMTLLKMTAESCFRSGDVEAVLTARKALAWAASVNAESADLDLVRMEAADHIISMMKTLRRKNE